MPSDPHVFDELKLPFIFVPHGAPEPTEWLANHRDYIKLPATFVPRGRGVRQADRVAGVHPEPLARGGSDGGPAGSYDATAPWPPTGHAMPGPMSDATNQTIDRASIDGDPIVAYLRASDALGTATHGHATGSNLYASVDNEPLSQVDPQGLRAKETTSSPSRLLPPPAAAIATEPATSTATGLTATPSPVTAAGPSLDQQLTTPAQGERRSGVQKAAPTLVAQSQTCAGFIAEYCKASILRVFPGQFLDVPVDDVLDAAKSGDAAARTARKLLFDSRFRK